MSDYVEVSKDEMNQQKIPTAWRSSLSSIVECLRQGDFKLERAGGGVQSLSDADALNLSKSIHAYGGTLSKLPEDTWNSSACMWMLKYWEVLVDLYMDDVSSDLVLSLRVYENTGSDYRFEVQSVFVP